MPDTTRNPTPKTAANTIDTDTPTVHVLQSSASLLSAAVVDESVSISTELQRPQPELMFNTLYLTNATQRQGKSRKRKRKTQKHKRYNASDNR